MLRILLSGLTLLALGGQPALAACSGADTTRVDEVYPSAAMVPENILRFYVYFTGPMGSEDILPNIELTKQDGMVIEGAFLSNRYELWSPDRTRLTLLFDPGRVKTGLDAHNQLGRALTPGESYTLTVQSTAADAEGCLLESSFTHAFTAGPSDVEPPDPAAWDITSPSAGSNDPLLLDLGSTHDHVSMAFGIQVQRNGVPIAGRLALSDEEQVWMFTPRQPWTDDVHTISINHDFEDLAGNRPGQLFDQPIGLELPQPAQQLSFTPQIN